MKRLLLTILLSFGFIMPSYAEGDRTVNFDLNSSVLKWTGKKVTGSHNGELKLKSAEGQIRTDNSVSGSFEVDMPSLKVVDIETPKDNKKLKDHLTSEDFFDVNAHPAVSFKITDSKPIKNAKAGEFNFDISGELSIKGITHPISFPAKIEVADGKVSAKGVATIDRTLFNVRYGSGKFFEGLGDKLIYDDFTVEVELHGTV